MNIGDVPFFQRPAGNMRVVAYDEAGNPVYENRNTGAAYSLGLNALTQMDVSQQREAGNALMTAAQQGQTYDPGLAAARQDIGTPVNMLAALAQGAWQGVAAPANALAGETPTYGDVWSTALDWGVMGAAGTAPKGALKAGGARAKGLTKAQAQAQEILDMLKSGRADDVTDDMMAAADDMYLYNNYDLPMDEAARMERAQGMGFDTETPMYHGSAAEHGLDRFDIGKAGSVSHQPNEPAVFLTESPKSASWFANYAHPDGELVSYGGPGEGFVVPASVRGKKLATDFRGQEYNPEWMARRITATKSRGADVMEVKGMRENLDGFRPIDHQVAVFNPANIRGRFARFDPRLKHLSNLSAGVAGAGIMAQDDVDIRSWLASHGY